MPYSQYAHNDQTGEYVGFDGTQWVPVHPREVPGTVAYKAQGNIDRMGVPARTPDRLGSLATGFKTGVHKIGDTINTLNEAAKSTPVFPSAGVAYALGKGLVQDSVHRLGNVIERTKEPGFWNPIEGLPQRGKATAHLVGALTGTGPVADVVEQIDPFSGKDSPEAIERRYRGIGEAATVAPMYAAPLLAGKGRAATGAVGRGLQKSGMNSLGKALGATGDELESLTTPGGRHNQAPAQVILERGGIVSPSRGGLQNKLRVKAAETGAAIRQAEDTISAGTKTINVDAVVSDLAKKMEDVSIPGQMRTVKLKSGKQVELPKGKTAIDDAYIKNLFEQQLDVVANSGFGDAVRMRREILDPAIQQAGGFERRASGADIPRGHKAFAMRDVRSSLADQIDAVSPEVVPDRQYVSALNRAQEVVQRNMDANWAPSAFGVPKTIWRNAIYRAAGYGAGALSGFGASAAAIDALQLVARSTLRRTVAATVKYRIGKFLEAGDLAGAGQYARTVLNDEGIDAPSSPSSPPTGLSGHTPAGTLPSRQTLALPESTPADFVSPAGDSTIPLGSTAAQAYSSAEPIPSRPQLPAGNPFAMPESSPAEFVNPDALRGSVPASNARIPITGLPSRSTPTPATTPYESVTSDFNTRNQLVAKEAGKIVDGRNANQLLRDVAEQRKVQAPTPAPKSTPAKAATPVPASKPASKSVPTPKPNLAATQQEITRLTNEAKRLSARGKYDETNKIMKRVAELKKQLAPATTPSASKPAKPVTPATKTTETVPSRPVPSTATGTNPIDPATHKWRANTGDHVTGTYKLTSASTPSSVRNAFKEFEISGKVKGRGVSKDGKAIYFVDTPEGSRILFEDNISNSRKPD